MKVDLSDEAIKERELIEKKEIAMWLKGNGLFINGLEKDIQSKGRSLDDVLAGLALLGIELDTAIDYAKVVDVESVTQLLAGAKETKDFIYSQLLKSYGLREVSFSDIPENLVLWRDYVSQKYNGGAGQCEFILTNLLDI